MHDLELILTLTAARTIAALLDYVTRQAKELNPAIRTLARAVCVGQFHRRGCAGRAA